MPSINATLAQYLPQPLNVARKASVRSENPSNPVVHLTPPPRADRPRVYNQSIPEIRKLEEEATPDLKPPIPRRSSKRLQVRSQASFTQRYSLSQALGLTIPSNPVLDDHADLERHDSAMSTPSDNRSISSAEQQATVRLVPPDKAASQSQIYSPSTPTVAPGIMEIFRHEHRPTHPPKQLPPLPPRQLPPLPSASLARQPQTQLQPQQPQSQLHPQQQQQQEQQQHSQLPPTREIHHYHIFHPVVPVIDVNMQSAPSTWQPYRPEATDPGPAEQLLLRHELPQQMSEVIKRLVEKAIARTLPRHEHGAASTDSHGSAGSPRFLQKKGSAVSLGSSDRPRKSVSPDRRSRARSSGTWWQQQQQQQSQPPRCFIPALSFDTTDLALEELWPHVQERQTVGRVLG